MLIIVFAIVLLIVGATFGAMKWFQLGPFAPKDTAAVEAAPKIQAPDALFVDVEPLMINVVQGNAVVTTIQMEVKLETAGNDNIIKIKRLLPKYKDAFVTDLHTFVPRMLRELGHLDLPTIKKRLKLVADRVTGDKQLVHSVLIQSIVDTPQQ